MLQEPAVEVSIVCDDRGVADESGDSWQHPVYCVGTGHRFVRYAGQLANLLRDIPRWTHALVQHPFVRNAVTRLDADNRDFDDPVTCRTETSRLDVENAQRPRGVVKIVRLNGPLDQGALPPAPGEVGRPISIDILYADGSDAGHEADREHPSGLVGERHLLLLITQIAALFRKRGPCDGVR